MKQNLRVCSVAEASSTLTAEAVVVTDSNVAGHWLAAFGDRFTCIVEAGEASKSWVQAGQILESLVGHGISRSTVVAALGGGVVGDLGGFAASVLLRGVSLVQIPTSLLAMVDSSIGGKVGVDLQGGKNLAGAFWPAQEVYLCPEFLRTLPKEEWQCGAAEVWKYGAIMDCSLWEGLMQHPLGPESKDIERVILVCANHKLCIVEEDPYEKTGLRAILNFGHTVGHAIEWALGYGAMTHGEAIAIGMVVEARLGEVLGFTEKGVRDLICQGMVRQGLPVHVPESLSSEILLKGMARDKKADSSGLAFSLLERLGQCKLVKGVPPSAVMEALKLQ